MPLTLENGTQTTVWAAFEAFLNNAGLWTGWLQLVDLVGGLIHTGDKMAEFGETGSGDQAHIAGTDHGNTHGKILLG